MKTLELYRYAEQCGIDVHCCPLPETGSLSLPLGDACHIGIDATRMTRPEECDRLAHELGHCLYAGFYSRDTPYELRERIEHKADVWEIRKLLPFDVLQDAVRQGYEEPWQLAEYFDLPEAFINKALQYYTQNCGQRL